MHHSSGTSPFLVSQDGASPNAIVNTERPLVAEGTQRALYVLRFACEIDDKDKSIKRYTVRWYSNGKVFYTYGYNVPRATSYRMYFQKRYKQENIGDGEIRIYNSDDVLIGRRVFTVDA